MIQLQTRFKQINWPRLFSSWKALGPGKVAGAWLLALALLLLPAGVVLLKANPAAAAIPTFRIVQVVQDQSVTIETANFPANQRFQATMGQYGTQGIGGIAVGALNSEAGGTLTATFNIPAQLKGQARLAIRLQTSQANPYFAYNWFHNSTAGGAGGSTPPPPAGYSGIPTFRIVDVAKDQSVTIETTNFPANQSFKVTMGQFGTKGIGGIEVGTLASGAGGKLTATYNIPDPLKGQARLALRAQTAHANPYFAYNWFYNNDDNVPPPGGTGGGPEPAPGYTGIPTIRVTAVKANESVTFETNNFPPNQTFTVLLGRIGSRGINGFVAGQFSSGAGGTMSMTVNIPAQLHGLDRMAIRTQTAHQFPYFSFNWFDNTTTP
ncbi:MAG: hypothetical protein L0332_32000 [Chloroflexi bacterium]|nr:hypothetical protein [Chloroflexota bacterium]MCI0576942.1 hypothetical protein [Chloroflexota bacterium]MCI0644774.1 hypothetical protein [Chloroflexota bacterium]MCI0731326.1 hypothetical protein [Chloroflexota bacterium]